MKKYFLDSNIYLRFILKDDPGLSSKARQYFLDAKNKKSKLFLTSEALIEINYVLQKVYSVDKKEIIRHLSALVRAPYFEVVERSLLAKAVRLYEKTPIDFVDCLLFARAKSQGGEVLTFDQDFKRLEKA